MYIMSQTDNKKADKKQIKKDVEQVQPVLTSDGLGLAVRIKSINRYISDVGVYELSHPLKDTKSIFVTVSVGKGVSGPPTTSVWVSDKDGKLLAESPYKVFYHEDLELSFKDLGYYLKR